jgi:AraC-like DNA-binding protein
MEAFRRRLAKLISGAALKEGLNECCIPGVHLIKYSAPTKWVRSRWNSSIAVVVQGEKEMVLEKSVHRYKEAHYVVTPVDLPVSSRIVGVSKSKPFLAVRIMISPEAIAELAIDMKTPKADQAVMPTHGLFTGHADADLLESSSRLLALLKRPEDAEELGRIRIKEILFHILKTANGPAIRQFITRGSKLYRITQSITRIKADLSVPINVGELAKSARMSRTSYFNSFKELTSMSPIQYQKRLRLIEARRLLLSEGETAESAAYKVGYSSVSQFSREYRRSFGDSPGRDANKNRDLNGAFPSR